MMPDLIPAQPSQERLVKHIRDQYQLWREEKERREPPFVVENVRFEHDPDWRSGFFSIQSARDCGHLGWQAVRVLYLGAALAPYLVRLL
jgi:hypothetical protein